jgi:hypothetical protein
VEVSPTIHDITVVPENLAVNTLLVVTQKMNATPLTALEPDAMLPLNQTVGGVACAALLSVMSEFMSV